MAIINFYEKIKTNNTIPQNPFTSLDLLNSMKDVKLVIMGQDPYSTGVFENSILKLYQSDLAFSVNTLRTPQSLKVLQEWFMLSDFSNKLYVGKVQNDLSYLLKRGVFLMNVIWSVEYGKPLSHDFPEYYEFSAKILNIIKLKYPSCRFLFLGNEAKRLIYTVKDKVYLTAPHPASIRYKENKDRYNNELYQVSVGLNIRFTL